MRKLLLILFVFFSTTLYSIEKVDSLRLLHAKETPNNLDLEQLVEHLKIGAKNDKQIVETFFYWIVINIKYDLDLYKKSNINSKDVSVDSVLLKHKTICTGYSELLYKMCDYANIECEIIIGIAQNYIEKQVEKSNHEWNAIKINNKWFLVDATWGSGGYLFGQGDYTNKMDIRYLFADPNFMIIDHYPDDKKWQLLKTPITLAQFQSKVWKEKRFRKFNNLLDDKEYENHLQMMKNNGWNR